MATGSFGGAFTKATAARKRTIKYDLAKRRMARVVG
jgi:hypothetical protein